MRGTAVAGLAPKVIVIGEFVPGNVAQVLSARRFVPPSTSSRRIVLALAGSSNTGLWAESAKT